MSSGGTDKIYSRKSATKKLPSWPFNGPITRELTSATFEKGVFEVYTKYGVVVVSYLTRLRFHDLTNEYGSIVGLKLGPQNVVILNSYRHVKA